MIAYGLGIFSLIWDLQTDHSRLTQPSYSNDAGAGGSFAGILQHLDNLMVQGPPQGYFLNPTKSILVVSPRNVPRSEDLLQGYGLQIVTGSRYLGGFMDTEADQAWWLE